MVVVVVVAIVGMNVVTGHYPTSDCRAKGIDPSARKEGSCDDYGTKLVVVDKHSVLKLDSLEAKLEGVSERKRTSGPLGAKTASGTYVVFDLALTNLTKSPQTFTGDQTRLQLRYEVGEDVAIDRDHEPRSFLARRREIPPHGSEVGTVTFEVSRQEVELLKKQGNLDIGNFGASTPEGNYEPEAMFEGSEYGVIRTYQ